MVPISPDPRPAQSSQHMALENMYMGQMSSLAQRRGQQLQPLNRQWNDVMVNQKHYSHPNMPRRRGRELPSARQRKLQHIRVMYIDQSGPKMAMNKCKWRFSRF